MPTTGRGSRRVARRRWAILVSGIMLIFGMVFMVEWTPLVLHNPSWNLGDDAWGIFRGAHYVGWGYLGGIYTPSNGIISFPGMSVLLAPLAMLSGILHLTESYPPYFLTQPTAALLLQPAELLLASTVVFASDALAECLQVPKGRRVALCFSVGLIAWPTAAIWGHAEDSLAVALAMYALVAFLGRRWARCGWLLAVGIVMQPLVGLLLPLLVGASPRGTRLLLALRSASLSVVLVGVGFIGNPSGTFRQLVRQPTPPAVNHATPWVALAPRVSGGGLGHYAVFVPGLGHPSFHMVTSRVELVSGGPGRSIDLLMAIAIGVYVWRRPQPPLQIVWLAAVVLASRCLFEAVMTPYYVAPPLMLALVLASRKDRVRFGLAVLCAVLTSVYAYLHLDPWVWWLPIVAGVGATVAAGGPLRVPVSTAPGEASIDSSVGVDEHRMDLVCGDEVVLESLAT